jgi:hypothetical protein
MRPGDFVTLKESTSGGIFIDNVFKRSAILFEDCNISNIYDVLIKPQKRMFIEDVGIVLATHREDLPGVSTDENALADVNNDSISEAYDTIILLLTSTGALGWSWVELFDVKTSAMNHDAFSI